MKTIYIEGTKPQLDDFVGELTDDGEVTIAGELTIVLNEIDEEDDNGGVSCHIVDDGQNERA